MNSKRLSLMALAVVFVALFALQSIAGQHTLAAQATAAATAAPTVTPTLLPSTEGTLTIWADTQRSKPLTALAKDFTAKYNVPVRVQEVGFGDIRNNLKIAGPAGTGPDILIGAHDWLGELVSNGLLSSIDLGDKTKSFDPVGLKAFTYDGKLYGMPYAVEAVALFYNKDLVPTPPTTWAELKDIAKKLQDSKKVDQAYILQQGDAYHYEPVLTGFGGFIFGTDKNGAYDPTQVGIDSEGAIAAAKEIDSMVKSGLLRADQTYDTMTSQFKAGKAAMIITGPWFLADVRKSGINYGVAKIPKMTKDARPFVGVQGFMVNKFSKNDLLAKTFLTEYVATDDAMQAIFDADPRIPAWLPVQAKVKDPDFAVFAQSVANGDPMPAIPAMNSVWGSLGDAVTLIFQQKGDPTQIMKDAAKSIRDKIASSK